MKKTIFSSLLLTGIFLASITVNGQVNIYNKKTYAKNIKTKRNIHHKKGVAIKQTRNRVVVVKPNTPHVKVKRSNRMRKGHIWIDGHWKWSAFYGKYVWIRARWERERRGYRWTPGYWKESSGGYFWVKGCWVL